MYREIDYEEIECLKVSLDMVSTLKTLCDNGFKFKEQFVYTNIDDMYMYKWDFVSDCLDLLLESDFLEYKNATIKDYPFLEEYLDPDSKEEVVSILTLKHPAVIKYREILESKGINPYNDEYAGTLPEFWVDYNQVTDYFIYESRLGETAKDGIEIFYSDLNFFDTYFFDTYFGFISYCERKIKECSEK